MRWENNYTTPSQHSAVLIVDTVIVGSVTKMHGGWFAFGSLREWEDTRLGFFCTERLAKRAVRNWVKDHE